MDPLLCDFAVRMLLNEVKANLQELCPQICVVLWLLCLQLQIKLCNYTCSQMTHSDLAYITIVT